jgi:hypothetical protein
MNQQISVRENIGLRCFLGICDGSGIEVIGDFDYIEERECPHVLLEKAED